jgi:hypothetical protein
VTIAHAISTAEKGMTPEEGRKVQAALCLKPDSGTVTFGLSTRNAIDMFRSTGGHGGPTDGLTSPEAILLVNAAPCDTKQFANAFEYFQYRSDDRATSADKISRLQEILAANVPAGKQPASVTGKLDLQTRAAIRDIQTDKHQTPSGAITRDFLDLLAK